MAQDIFIEQHKHSRQPPGASRRFFSVDHFPLRLAAAVGIVISNLRDPLKAISTSYCRCSPF